MFRLWGKIYKNNNIISDHVFESQESNLSLEENVDQGLEALCYHFDIQKPMWLTTNDKDFELIGKTRFMEEHFMEDIHFDWFEIELIEAKK